MKKRILGAILAATMMLGLCACGDKDDKTDIEQGNHSQSGIVETPNNNQQNVEQDPVTTPDKPVDNDPVEPEVPEEPIIIDTNPHLTSEIDTTGFATMGTDVAFTNFLIPDNMSVNWVSYSDYVAAEVEKATLNSKKDAARIAELNKLLDKTIRTSDKGYVSYVSNELNQTVVVMTLENNTKYTGSDLDSGTLLKLLEKTANKQNLFEKVTLKDITHQSKTKAIAEIILTDYDGNILKGHFAVNLNTQYISCMIVAQDAYSLGKDWMLVTAKSLEVGR